MTYKADWVTGDILTAAQQNSLAEQAVSRFADASARNAAITSPTEGQACWLNDTNEFQIYDGSSWKPLLDTDTISVSSGNYTITTDLTVSGNVTIQTLDMDDIVEGDVIYGSGADALARLAKGSDDEVLTLASGVPSWAAAGGVSWSGSTANGLATYGDASTIVAESTATYDGTTLTLTQSGGGLKMDGLNSADANTLDDYEEGTWQAVLSPGSGSITMGTNDTGAYIKIGRAVFVSGTFNVDSVSTPGGGLNLTGLPFTSGDVSEQGERAIINVALFFTSSDMNGPVQGHISTSATQAYVDNLNGRAARQDAAAFVDAGTSANVGGMYYANA